MSQDGAAPDCLTAPLSQGSPRLDQETLVLRWPDGHSCTITLDPWAGTVFHQESAGNTHHLTPWDTLVDEVWPAILYEGAMLTRPPDARALDAE